LLKSQALKTAILLVYIKNEKKRPIICFMCLGNKIAPFNTYVYLFSSLSNLSKYFKRKHLGLIREGQILKYKLYKILLNHKIYLQNYATRIYRTIL
jgi:hypothetical protein